MFGKDPMNQPKGQVTFKLGSIHVTVPVTKFTAPPSPGTAECLFHRTDPCQGRQQVLLLAVGCEGPVGNAANVTQRLSALAGLGAW